MKLILENWNNFLNEQAEGGGVELYHATCAPPEAFDKGIDVSLAKGYGQGEGFYLFTNKDRAIKHAKNHLLAGGTKEVEQDCSKGAYIVIVDEPVTPENYDIDYENYGTTFANFMLKNLDFFKQNADKLQLGQRSFANFDDPKKPGFRKGNKTIILPTIANPNLELNVGQGELLSKIARDLANLSPEMFRKFEEEILPNAPVIKYNGKKQIFPLRIEDLEGKTVWSRK